MKEMGKGQRQERKKGSNSDNWLDMERNKQRGLIQLQSYRILWLYDYNLVSEKEKQTWELVWEQDEYVLLKINGIWTKALLGEIKFMKDWLKAVQSIHSTLYLKIYPLESPGQQRAMHFMDSLQKTPFRLFGSSGCAPPEKVAGFYYIDNEQ